MSCNINIKMELQIHGKYSFPEIIENQRLEFWALL